MERKIRYNHMVFTEASKQMEYEANSRYYEEERRILDKYQDKKIVIVEDVKTDRITGRYVKVFDYTGSEPPVRNELLEAYNEYFHPYPLSLYPEFEAQITDEEVHIPEK